MSNQNIHNPRTYSASLKKLTVQDPVHENVLNPILERLINNDAYINQKVTYTNENSFHPLTPHTDFPTGITYSVVRSDSPGYSASPKGTGTLVTHKMNSVHSTYNFQVYYGWSGGVWERKFTTDGAFTPWEKLASYSELTAFRGIPLTDGALTQLFRTALTYVNNDELIYGNPNTLFSSGAPDANGKYQIDCSSFVQACMEGITFENSKYKNDKNYPNNYGFQFPDSAKSSGRMLANDLGEYAYQNGWAYEPLPDYSNLRPGDLIFLFNNPNGTFWKDIGHVMLVSRVNQRENTSITVVEATSAGTGTVVKEVTYSVTDLVNKKAFLCARYPLIDSGFMPKVINYDAEKVITTTTASTWVIAPIRTMKPLKEQQMYTLFIKADFVEPGGYPIVRFASNDTIYTFGGTAKRRPDKMFRVNFFIPKGRLTAEWLNKLDIYVAGSSGTTVSLVALYEGYVTEYSGVVENIPQDQAVYGSNANGDFTKYPDGTMICRLRRDSTLAPNTALGSIFRSASESWTFPHPFVSATNLTVHVSTVFTSRWADIIGSPTATSVSYNVMGALASEDGGAVFLTAIGRWK